MENSFVDSKAFKRILTQNVVLPVGLTMLLCAIFALLLYSLLAAVEESRESDIIISRANETLRRIIDAETGARGYYIAGKENFLEPLRGTQESLDKDLQGLVEMVGHSPRQTQRIERTRAVYKDWLADTLELVRSKRLGTYKLGDGAEEQKQKMDSIRVEFRDFLSDAENTKRERQEAASQQTGILLIVTVVLAVGVGLVMAWMGRRQVLSLSGSYQQAMDNQIRQNREITAQNWLRTGQAELAQKIRGDLGETALADKILEALVGYVDASVGAFYVARENRTLERVSAYAFPGDSRYGSVVRWGEGLVGQAAASQAPISLAEVPDTYLRVASGLGERTPSHLLVMPLTADGTTQGVVELAFNQSIAPRVNDLMREVAEMVGIALRSSSYRIKLQELLSRSQALTEELQTQQEELRVSNEELEERSKALMEAQARLEGQHAELEQSNEQLEEQAQLLEQQKESLDRQNQELERTRVIVEAKAEELSMASRYKSEFLANMSHELRTPLNSSLILAKLLKDNPKGNLSSEQVEFANTIYSAGNDLLTLINDILDLSKVEAGHLEVHAEKVSLEKMLAGLRRTFEPMANDKKLGFKIDRDGNAADDLFTDRLRVEQILKNLLSNAIKFTSQGSVEMVVEKGPDGFVKFRVTDTGVGIPADQQEGIFEAFRQADGTTSRKYGGTGLGLSISRSLTNLLGGNLAVESEVGKGSTFTLLLPLELPETAKTTPASAAAHGAIRPTTAEAKRAVEKPKPVEEAPKPVKGVPRLLPDDRDRITIGKGKVLLIVEDEAAFAKIVMESAKEYDFQCLVTDNTSEGYDMAVAYLPNAVILDMKLPDGSGLTLLDRLKSNPKTRHIPVHVVSAMDYNREALHLGAVGYVSKPLGQEQLKETFRVLESKIQQRIRKVLVVEDDPVQRMAIETLISEKSVEIVSVGLGEEALEKLAQMTFDCIIIDLSLPDMTGFELLDRMSENAAGTFTPVIVYTGRSITRDEEDRLARFSRSIIIKGARSPERLLDEVTLFLHQVESQLSPEKREILMATRNREKAFEGRKILLVDDDVRNIFALTNALELKGAKIKAARNGREALETLEKDGGVDLVLMDIMMPEMDGYEAMRRIRKEERFRNLPIIAVTAKAMRDDYEKCLEAGANDYLPKPVDLEKLVSLMRVWLPKEIGRV